jgi:hypothetical protein
MYDIVQTFGYTYRLKPWNILKLADLSSFDAFLPIRKVETFPYRKSCKIQTKINLDFFKADNPPQK